MNPSQKKSNTLLQQHFIGEKVETEVDGVIVERTNIQRVERGQLLVSLVAEKSPPAAGEKGDLSNILVAGEHVELSDQGTELYASMAGYPFVKTVTDGDSCTVSCLVLPIIKVSADGMRVMLNIFPPLRKETMVTVDDLLEEMAEQKIVFGIDRRLLEEKLDRFRTEKTALKGIVVGRGVLPVAGEDGYLRFETEIGPIAGKIMGDGSIDFRERRLFVGVNEGELIATKVLPTPGTPGTNVFGEAIAAKSGKDIQVKVSDGARYLEEKHEVRAARSGILCVVNNREIKVTAKLMISGDVDYTTGNIICQDGLEVSGSILPDFNVKTRGDVRICGNVQAASVRSWANVVVSGGVTGKKSRIRARGDVDVHFVGRAKITAGGNIIIRKEAYYCRLLADGDVHGDERSRIVGGVVACGGSFRGGVVGGPNAEAAVIAVGVDKKQYSRLLKLQKKISELEEKKAKDRRRYGGDKMYDSPLLRVNKRLEKLQKDLRGLTMATEEKDPFIDSAEIVCHGIIYAGTRLRIGGAKKTLERDYTGIRCVVGHAGNEIVIKPLILGE